MGGKRGKHRTAAMSEPTTQLLIFNAGSAVTETMRRMLELVAQRPIAARVSIEVDLDTGRSTAYIIYKKEEA
jgi:hypothetical protein